MKKDIISISDSAIEQLKTIYETQNNRILKIAVDGKGCSGYSYDMEFVDNESDGDEIIERDGIRVAVDKTAVLYLIGTTLDYKSSLMEQGFKFLNPNAISMCGCGKSFAV